MAPPPDQIPTSPRSLELAHLLAGLAIAFMILSSALFSARIYTRTRPVLHLGIDDWVASIAYILTTVDACIFIASVRYTLFKSPQFFLMKDLANLGHTALASALIGAWAIAAIKSSVACLFLRLKKTRSWRIFLFAMLALQFVTATFNTIMHSTRYIPVTAQWSLDLEARVKAQVWSDQAFRIGFSISSSSNILTDVIFSLLPIVFLRDIQRPFREKVVVGGLMALGLVASSASIAKTVKAQQVGRSNDPISEGRQIAIWALLEEQLGLMVACVPCLKALFQRVLARFGLITTSQSHVGSSAQNVYADGRSHNRKHASIRCDANKAPFFSLDDQSIELVDGAVGKVISPTTPLSKTFSSTQPG